MGQGEADRGSQHIFLLSYTTISCRAGPAVYWPVRPPPTAHTCTLQSSVKQLKHEIHGILQPLEPTILNSQGLKLNSFFCPAIGLDIPRGHHGSNEGLSENFCFLYSQFWTLKTAVVLEKVLLILLRVSAVTGHLEERLFKRSMLWSHMCPTTCQRKVGWKGEREGGMNKEHKRKALTNTTHSCF